VDGDEWRGALINGVLGSSLQIDHIISSFRSDPDIGMVVADGNIYRGQDIWASNEKKLAELLPRVGISPDVRDRAFPGGSIFWIRPLLLRTLAHARVNIGDFEPEPVSEDGSLPHALERMFGLICEDAGMRVVESSQLPQIIKPPIDPSRVHVIAFYLPQFHPVPENDKWWGAGFTEWTNVTRAKPLFRDHRQPRLPSDLGFYDLRLPEVRKAQAKLAGRYGLAAFCYYYYWFNGRRILERPLDEVLVSGEPDFPFLICWANEPWTRNWDGLNRDILLPQTYEPGWTRRFARDVAPLLRDRRYFRLNGKPMLLIYRIGHIPGAGAALRDLRLALSEEGVSEIHFAAAWMSFPEDADLPADPNLLSLDSYYEFPPHWVPSQPLRPLPADLCEEFYGTLHDYNRTVTAALGKLNEPFEGQRHRGVMLGWDSTARRGPRAVIYHGATPTSFRRWLRGTIAHERRQRGERVVFINAWNEWAEGTYLEPDADFGCGWLEAVASAAEVEASDEARIIRDSGLFDEAYYLAHNPDVTSTGADPIVHFLEHGGFEGRNPHPLMHVSFYLQYYPDAVSSGLNPAVHYALVGAPEQRICNPVGHSPFDNYGLLPGETPDLAGVKEKFLLNPLISVVMPVYATRQEHERVVIEAIRSIQSQTYVNWELCICDDCSTSRSTMRALDELRDHEPRIRAIAFEANQGISAATNAALRLAEGEFVALMDHDDMLTPNALYEVVKAVNRYPGVDVLYTDQDKIDLENNRIDPFHKPAWSPELFRGVMYVGHLLVVRRSLLTRLGGFDARFNNVQDYELMLRLSEITSNIVHIPKILYHWRMIPDSVALGTNEKSGIEDLQAAAVTAHLGRLGVRAKAITNGDWPHRVKILPDGLRHRPKVSIVIPSKDAPNYIGRCLETIFTNTSYDNYEVVVVDTGTRDPRALEILHSHPIIHCFYEPYDFSRVNNFGVSKSSGEYLVFLNNDTEVVTEDWIENMLFYLLEYNDVGIVGPLLIYPDGSVQHAGVVLGFRGTADHVMRFFTADADGYAGSLSCAREVSAVTAACLMMPRALFDEIGGFTNEFATHYQDVDLCLRVREKGLRILFTPHSRLLHHESISRGNFYDHLDRDLILDIWGEVIEKGDPYYNINFDRNRFDYTIRKTTS
jgi:GT2 family glycosyltransferase/lipopolysaccharide biosynthesis protein